MECSKCEGTGHLCDVCGETCSADDAGECDWCREERESEEAESDD